MNKLLVIIILAMLSYWAWENQAKIQKYWIGFEEKIEGIFARRIETPEEAPKIAPEEEPPPPLKEEPVTVYAPPPQMTQLPEGVYYTKERVTEVTDLGVRSILAGIRVQKTGEAAGKMLVHDGKTTVAVDEWRLTRDPLEVAQLLQELSGSPRAGDKTNKTAQPPPTRKPPTRTAAQRADPAAVTAMRGQLTAIEARMSQVKTELIRVRNKQADARSRGNSSSYGSIIGTLTAQLESLQAQRAAATNQLNAMLR